MASVTRSNRRAEVHPHHHQHHHHQPTTRPPATLFVSNDGNGGGHHKRALDPDLEHLKPKRARIAVEILSRQHHPPVPVVDLKTSVQIPPIAPRSTVVHPALPISRPPLPPSTFDATAAHGSGQVTNVPPSKPSPVIAPGGAASPPSRTLPDARQLAQGSQVKPAEKDAHSAAKHQSKPVQGINAELHRLQPHPDATREQGRKLRSQEATRFKSDLSAYFPDYDETVGNDPKENHLLNSDTPIVVVDSRTGQAPQETQSASSRAPPPEQSYSVQECPVRGYGDSLYSDVFDSQRIDFRFLETQNKNANSQDPLPDSLFEPSHKKAERLERSIRNSEKGRAQHEKDQIIRLLEGLQGHDWLKVMGVSGVTETKKKSFEPARAHFIKGCQGIIEKFRIWNLEEKRRKQEKGKALHAEQRATLTQQQQHDEQRRRASEISDSAAEGDTERSQPTAAHGRTEGAAAVAAGGEAAEDSEDVVTSQSDTSDASPAKQLRQEAFARSQMAAAHSKKVKASTRPISQKQPEPPRPFTSFFSKKHERDAALNRTRRTGRKVLAWGHIIPEMEEVDFDLPEAFRNEELLKSRARKKRRDKRHGRP